METRLLPPKSYFTPGAWLIHTSEPEMMVCLSPIKEDGTCVVVHYQKTGAQFRVIHHSELRLDVLIPIMAVHLTMAYYKFVPKPRTTEEICITPGVGVEFLGPNENQLFVRIRWGNEYKDVTLNGPPGPTNLVMAINEQGCSDIPAIYMAMIAAMNIYEEGATTCESNPMP